MENTVFNNQHCLKYGLYTGLALIGYALIFYILGTQPSGWLGLIGYALLIGGILMSTMQYRDTIADGFISFGTAFKVGLLVSVACAIILAFFNFVLFTVIDTNLINEMYVQAEQQMIEQGNMSDEQMEQALTMTKKMMTPTSITLVTVFMYSLFGAVFSLIVAAFVKKEKPMFEN